MKNKSWLIVLIIYLLISIVLYIYDKETIGIMIMIFFPVIAPGVGVLYLRGYQIDAKKVSINVINEKRIMFSYEDINYDLNMDEFFQTRKIPVFDTNGKKTPSIFRNNLRDYLLENYNGRKLQAGINYISNDKILNTFNDFQACDDDTKKRMLNYSILHTKLWWVFILIVGVFFVGIIWPTINDVSESGFTTKSILILVIFAILLIIGIIIGLRYYIHANMSTMYYKKMFVYEQKSIRGDDGPSCFLRFWDNEKNVLYKWFEVSIEDYGHPIGTPVFIYVVSLPKGNFVTFRFIEEKKED